MDELKYMDSSKIGKAQAINLITKHVTIAIQAFNQTATKKKSFHIWEQLGKFKNTNNEQ